MKRLVAMCSVLLMVILAGTMLATAVVAQEGGAESGAMDSAQSGKKHKQTRWEGVVTRSNKDKKTLTVRQRGSNVEKQVVYDDSTRWTSQEHGSKKVNDIDASQVSDNDRVICLGSYDKGGVFHATLISKRLTP
jgi:Ni/Co efflux regulator RcnB